MSDGEHHNHHYVSTTIKGGISFGSALAIAISFTVHHSVLWAIIQGILGWIYVVYYLIVR